MKKLFLALMVLGLITGTSLTAFPYEDRRDHDWNDEYWHHHHYGYWHGSEATGNIAITNINSSESGPELGGLRPRVANKGITFNAQYVAEVWGNPTGGMSTGIVYTGLMSLQGNVDLQSCWMAGLAFPHVGTGSAAKTSPRSMWVIFLRLAILRPSPQSE